MLDLTNQDQKLDHFDFSANIDADFNTPGNNQSAPSFEPRGNTSIGGAPAPKSQGGNFNSIDQGTSSPKPRSIRELFRSKDFKNQFSSKQEMRQFKRELRQEFKNNPGSRKSFNKALRDGFDPTDPKSFENATPEQRKAFKDLKKEQHQKNKRHLENLKMATKTLENY